MNNNNKKNKQIQSEMSLIVAIVNKRPGLQLRSDQHSQWSDGAVC